MDNKRSQLLAHWGFTHWPFCTTPPVTQLYPTSGLTEALARVDYLIDSRRRLGVLLGESGVGKSLTLKAVARQLERQGHSVVLLDATAMSTRELAWLVANGFGAAMLADDDMAKCWRRITDRVIENRVQQRHSVLLVDNAGLAGPDVVSQLVRLTRIDSSPAARWTMVLSAEPAQTAMWTQTLRELVDLRIELVAWSEEDTIGYVQMSLLDAGRIEPLFDDHAILGMHRLAHGVPRQVARLADFALLAGAGAGLDRIDLATIEAAHEEVVWPLEVAAY